jgi:hypothetical protein
MRLALPCTLVAFLLAAPSFAQSATTPAPPPAPTASPAPAAQDDEEDSPELLVQLKDGRRYSGPLIRQDKSETVISIAGIPMTFSAADIERTETLPPLMERYRALREAVGSDPDQIVRLAEWLQSREKYALALTEVDRALSIDKTNAAALKLRPLLREQIILQYKRVKKEPEPSVPAASIPQAPAPQRAKDFPLLSDADVNLIKVFETNFDEHPRIIIPRAAVQKMLEKYSSHPLVPITKEGRDAILRQSPAEQLDLMFKLQARDFYPDVQVLDQPRAFITFRDQLSRNWLINSCATNACHGGTEAGRLILYNGAPNQPRSLYTNFLILSRFKLDDGSPLIDFEQPERSPLLQLGLARDKSRRPHPVVPRGLNHDAWRPVFRTADDAQFKAAVEWIKSLYRPRPDYPIDYTPLRPFEPPKPPPPAPAPAPVAHPEPAPAAPPAPDSPSAQPSSEPKPEPKPR